MVGACPTVDVLIVSYNGRDLLADCLESIERYPPEPSVAAVNVRVLDNASSDGTLAMIKDRFPEVSLEIVPDNLGFARANNRLVASSDADYLMLLNPDTRWKGDVIGPLLMLLRQSPEAIAVGPRLDWPDGTRQLSAQDFPSISYELALLMSTTSWGRVVGRVWNFGEKVRSVERPDISTSQPSETPSLWATCWLARRSDIAAVGLFDERYVTYDEDLDFCRRMRDRGRVFVYEPRITVTHVGGGSSSPDAKAALMQRGRYLYYARHHGRAAAFMYRRVLPALATIDRRLRRTCNYLACFASR